MSLNDTIKQYKDQLELTIKNSEERIKHIENRFNNSFKYF